MFIVMKKFVKESTCDPRKLTSAANGYCKSAYKFQEEWDICFGDGKCCTTTKYLLHSIEQQPGYCYIIISDMK